MAVAVGEDVCLNLEEIGKAKKQMEFAELSVEEKELFEKTVTPRLDAAVFGQAGKEKIDGLKKEWAEAYKASFPAGNVGLALALLAMVPASSFSDVGWLTGQSSAAAVSS